MPNRSDLPSSLPLSGAQKRTLRGRAHSLRPAVHVGRNGVTDSVARELEAALAKLGLIKVRLPALERAARAELLDSIVERLECELVGRVGHVAVLFRPLDEP